MASNVRTPLSRVFTIEDRAGPAQSPVYQQVARVLGPSQDFGSVTPVREPDPDAYGRFRIVDTIRGERGLPEIPLQVRYQFTLSEFLRLARKACPLDVQIHMGQCQNPGDFDNGWDKILVVEGGVITNWSVSDLGALEQGEDAVVNEEVPLMGLDMYEITQLLTSELGATQIVQEIIAVQICDSVQCGLCGIATDGCDKVLAVTLSAGGSPGLPAEVIYSNDGGTTIGETNISTLGADEDPTGAACVGANFIVISNDDDALHWAPVADILNATETWTRVATGILAAGSPNAIYSAGPNDTWIVGDGGHIYHTVDPTAGVTVQDAGIATTDILNAVHALDILNVVAVGANNAVVRTTDGGSSWASVVGPSPAVVLNTIFMRTELEWFIGDAGGQLWYTRDAGVSWTEKTFPGSSDGEVRHVTFPTPTVGYMAHDTSAPAGRILRTVNGGSTWYVLPEGTTSIQANDHINEIAACAENPNLAFGGGLADDAVDGFLVKAS